MIKYGSDITRVLIYRLGSLGDTVVALPALHLVAQTFPNAKRLMLTNFPVHAKSPASAAVLGDSKLIDGYISYPVATRNYRQLARLWWQIRRFGPQVGAKGAFDASHAVRGCWARVLNLCGYLTHSCARAVSGR